MGVLHVGPPAESAVAVRMTVCGLPIGRSYVHHAYSGSALMKEARLSGRECKRCWAILDAVWT